tara:strand:+ start:803 stop:1687 length:885 start_codon:yes stop_codon:yes gene_type:complete
MADEDLSPDLEDLKFEIEKSAGVDEEVKDTVPTTDAVPEKDSRGAAMEKAGAALAGVAAKTEGVTDDEDTGPEEEVALDDIQDDTDATTPETADDSPVVEDSGIDFENQEPEPVQEPEYQPVTPVITEEMRAEARDQFGVAQRVASMLPAEYELWLFPAMGTPGYHEGQVTLARVINNLTSAGYNKDTLGYDAIIYPKVVQIAAATWSQTNYSGCDVIETRDQLTLAPASQVVDLLPNLETITHDIMAPAFPQVDTVEIEIEAPRKSYVGPALIGVASISALVLPILLVRRSMQ